jgi:hypothetical protein
MSFICNLCNTTFVQNKNLQRHLVEKRCKSELVNDLLKLNNFLEEQKNKIKQLTISGDNNVVIERDQNNINMKIEINISPQPITKLNVSYIDQLKMKELIEAYDSSRFMYHGSSLPDEPKNSEKINIAISDYIKDIICNKEHPENHSVKYIKKDPPTFNTITEDSSGNTITVIKGLKDTCELLTDPILDKLKIKIREFVHKYKKDDDFDLLYDDAIRELRKELNKKTVKKALSSVLKNDILNNIEMKLSGSIKKLKVKSHKKVM